MQVVFWFSNILRTNYGGRCNIRYCVLPTEWCDKLRAETGRVGEVNYPFNCRTQQRMTCFGSPTIRIWALSRYTKYKPNLTLTLTLILIQTLILILTQILTLKPTWVDTTIRSHFGCSYIEKEPGFGKSFIF